MDGTTRRGFLESTGLGLAGLVLGCTPGGPTGDTAPFSDPATEACEATEVQTEGPFFEAGVPVRSDLDLYDEEGTPLRFEGRVVDTDCRPIENAVVDLWHADPGGAYDDSAEHRYRGQQATDADGRFGFTTLKPGHYEVDANWTRPAHLHVKVRVGGTEVLTTQLYFEGDPFNDDDNILVPELVMAVVEEGDGIATAYELVV